MWCWRRIKKIIQTNRVKHDKLQRVKEERNILQTVKIRKVNWILEEAMDLSLERLQNE